MPGFKAAKKVKKVGGVKASAPKMGGGNCGTGNGGFKPGNKCGVQAGSGSIAAKPGVQKNAQQYTSAQYAKAHGISETQSSHHLNNLITQGHARGGTIGGTTHVKEGAPYPKNSKIVSKNPKSVGRSYTPAQYAKKHGIGEASAWHHLDSAHMAGKAVYHKPTNTYFVPHETKLPHHEIGDPKQNSANQKVVDEQKKLNSAKSDLKTAKRNHSEAERNERKKLAHDIRSARSTIKDKDDRETFARHAKLLKEHREGKGTITKEHAGTIRDRFQSHGNAAIGGKELPKQGIRTQAEAARIEKNRHRDSRLIEIGIKKQTAFYKKNNLVDPSTHTNHPAGHVGMLDTNLIHTDPHRFQYKQGHNETGSVGSLAGVKKFDHNLAGVVQVWKDPADGKTYVVNGHNRLDKAKELGADKITVRYLDAKDHKTARSIGALTNIAEGRGTAIDAAKYFKDTGLTPEQIADKGIPLREKVATDGIALSKLDKTVFDKVVQGDISVNRGSIIGSANLSHSEQTALLKSIDGRKGKREITDSHLKELVDEVKSARSVRQTTNDLFGSHEDDHSLAINKTKIQSIIKDKLSKEKKLFGIVAKSKHAEELSKAGNTIDTEASGKVSAEAAQVLGVFDRLKNLSGPISKRLNDAAERIHKGENAKKVTDETYRAIVKHIPEMLSGGHEFDP